MSCDWLPSHRHDTQLWLVHTSTQSHTQQRDTNGICRTRPQVCHAVRQRRMRAKKCPVSVSSVRVPSPTSWISDIPALLVSARNSKAVQCSSTETVVYKKGSGARSRGRRTKSSRGGGVNSSFSDVEDEITEMRIKSQSGCACIGPGVGVHIPRDNILEEENSSPLTKLEYKLENHELAKETANKRVASLSRLKINKGNSVSVSSNPVKVSISRGKSQKYGVTTFQKIVKVWEAPREEKNQEKLRKSSRKVKDSSESVPTRRANLRSRAVDLSELPLSHVKQMRQKIKKNAGIKNSKFKHFLKKKLNGRLVLQNNQADVRSKLRFRERPSRPPVERLESSPEVSSLSLTVFDADVARPSRPIHRPVRYLDSLNQNAEHIAIKKLNLVDKLDLPYDKESLNWNRSHSKNKQVSVWVYGGPC